MDIKLLPASAKPLSTLLCSVALGFIFFSPTSYGEQFLCDATQRSAQELPLLDKSCPIGNGLWGKQQPKGSESTFWIQCGVLSKPLSVDEAKVIYQKISTDVWGKIEGRNARCLIGPYNDFAQASKELKAVKTLKPYQQAFIREVVKGAAATPKAAKPIVTQPTVIKANTDKKVAEKKQSTTVIPAPKPIAKPKPVVAAMVPKPADTQVTIRREAVINGTQYKVPYMIFSDEQFYMEYEMPWNRLNFEGAAKLCQQIGMQLPNAEQWQTLLEAKLMVGEQWPIHLPYWGAERTGLFTNGKTNHIKGSSLLNVMCVK
ncbi:SPOR domain-containing protein [Vibrio scophthalmi]|uniref:SPOR domain-containing protein n=1 Tax=Vibrio scophthalmi TaxID=45658 RepID=UPI003AAEE140